MGIPLRSDMIPDRIMISPDYAVPLRKAPSSDVRLIFIREDGWKLGCSMEMVFWAHRTWSKEWKGVMVKMHVSGWKHYPIEDWRKLFFGPDGCPGF